MAAETSRTGMNHKYFSYVLAGGLVACLGASAWGVIHFPRTVRISSADADSSAAPSQAVKSMPSPVPMLDIAAYNEKLLEIANLKVVTHETRIRKPHSTSTELIISTSTVPIGWPVKAAYPNVGALLPFDRIIAYYGNLYSTQMGVLGKYPEPEMLARLASTTAAWQAADPETRTIPALDYIAVAAQAGPGPDGKYRLRMPADQMDKIVEMALRAHAIVILDVQVGLSTVQEEVPLLEPYLKLPQVHLALDPEFAMHNGARPGRVIGSLDAKDINDAAEYLARLVRENNLPPKILVVHRFTQPMVTHADQIKPLPEVQIVMDMDGFGPPSMKLQTYHDFIQSEPVQFTGFKLFYVNDAKAGHLMTPEEVLRLAPRPSFIQYQ